MFWLLVYTDDDDESSSGEDEDDESTGAEEIKLQMQGKPAPDKVSSRKETEAGAEISALVNYVQPIHFVSFEMAESTYQFSVPTRIVSFRSECFVRMFVDNCLQP